MTNHPTQGLQDMTLDLSTYSDAGLKELQTRIEEEKTKRERKVPFVVGITSMHGEHGGQILISRLTPTKKVVGHMAARLSAEAKLRSLGGGGFKQNVRPFFLSLREDGTVTTFACIHYHHQGSVYFKTEDQALSAYATLTPDEQAAIFGFGDSSNEGEG